MTHPLSTLALTCVVAMLPLAAAQAAPVVSLVPQATQVLAFQNLRVDVVVSGLRSGGTDAYLGAFDLTLSYDASAFQFLQVGSSLGTALGDPSDGSQTAVLANTAVPGVLRFLELSLLEESGSVCTFCIGPYLADLQPAGGFRLASLLFYVPGLASTSATSAFGVDAVQLSDAGGQTIARVTTQGATVAVPEPASLALATLGLWVLALNRRTHPARGRVACTLVAGDPS